VNPNKWYAVPYTRGVVQQTLPEELWFPHFVRECTPGTMLDALVGDGDLTALRPQGHWITQTARPPGGAPPPVGGSLSAARGGNVSIFRKNEDGSLTPIPIDSPENSCVIVRLGAWGDLMQMTSILPGLKAHGFHITLHCSTRGYDVVQHEPLIDSFVLQDPDQVPNTELTAYFNWLESRCTRFVNLCESVEGTLLAQPGRPVSFWPKAARHAVCNTNYVELTHMLAQVPYQHPQTRFVPTQDELTDMQQFLQKHGGQPNILWTVSGSAVHKIYPHTDSIIARMLVSWPNCRIFMMGDQLGQLIETPWENEPRIIKMCGIASIRQSMTLAQACDLVIGPETGIMSAVSTMDMGKVVFLSHSSVDNLTRDWINTQSVFSKKTPCYPCHKMIYGWDQCVQGVQTGTAQCQEDIDPDHAWQAIQRAMRRYQLRKVA